MTRSRFREKKKRLFWIVRLIIAIGPSVWLIGLHAPFIIPAAWSTLVVFLVMFPRSCRATNKDGTLCGSNAYGLLGACHIQRHKWQNAWRMIPLTWRPPTVRPDLHIARATTPVATGAVPVASTYPGLWGTPTAVVTTIGSLSSAVAVVVSLLAWWFPFN